ncbi:hypothetical protein WL1483_2856 [Aeromonas schubertii]|uniref:Uncharacterized protein n=1 Tax=Aeromonas schubertii TaxID=652 RepID=A0A0S2SKP8_9GAMM|nr:hypothetical protein WL1483_2856 [Aeromonas schubertii]
MSIMLKGLILPPLMVLVLLFLSAHLSRVLA